MKIISIENNCYKEFLDKVKKITDKQEPLDAWIIIRSTPGIKGSVLSSWSSGVCGDKLLGMLTYTQHQIYNAATEYEGEDE